MEEFEHDSFRCLVSVPVGDPSEQGWPVLVFLHGSAEAAPIALHSALTLHGPLNPAADPVAVREFLIVAPQLPAPGGNVWGSRADDVRSIARQIAARRCGDPEKMYLTGFSYGGNGVFGIGAEQPEAWAALWAVDPTELPPAKLKPPIWVSAGQYARRIEKELKDLLDVRDRNPGEAPSMDQVYEDAGLEHVETARNAYGSGEPYRWLLGREL